MEERKEDGRTLGAVGLERAGPSGPKQAQEGPESRLGPCRLVASGR